MGALFVTATDTGVGKTIITAGLARVLKEQGQDVGVMKPISCGTAINPDTGQEVHADTVFLKKSIDSHDPDDLINPIALKAPLAPSVAAEQEGTEVDLVKAYEAFKKLNELHSSVIVEGVGGLLVPIRQGYLVSHLIREWGLPIVIVGRLGLGTINHTLLTIRQAQNQGLKIQGVILNRCEDRPDGVAEQTNAHVIEAESSVRVLGMMPFDCEIDVHRCCYGNLTASLGQNVDVGALFP